LQLRRDLSEQYPYNVFGGLLSIGVIEKEV
jgi:hypothetical protein